MSSLAEKSVLITGASSGIGAQLARELVARGARVGLLARREDRLRELAGELEAVGGQAAWAVADVTDDDDLEHALETLAGELGGVDVLIANAGYGRPEPPHKFRPGRSLRMYDTNLFGMLRAIDWALPRFLNRGSGHIVGISSIASFAGMTHSASYCGSKAAMRVHLQGLRVSLKPYGIAVTTICPGFVKSELTAVNSYSMPFIWETDRAARKIADAIEKCSRQVVFPWQMAWLAAFMVKFVPLAFLEWVMSRFEPKGLMMGTRAAGSGPSGTPG